MVTSESLGKASGGEEGGGFGAGLWLDVDQDWVMQAAVMLFTDEDGFGLDNEDKGGYLAGNKMEQVISDGKGMVRDCKL